MTTRKKPPAAGKLGGQSPKRPRGQEQPITRKRRPGAGRKPRAGTAATTELRVGLTEAEAAQLRDLAGSGTVAAYVRRRVGLGSCPPDADPLSYEVTQSLDVDRLARAAERRGVGAVYDAVALATRNGLLDAMGRAVDDDDPFPMGDGEAREAERRRSEERRR